MNLTALKLEIVNDPASIGYATAYTLRDSVTLSSLLNIVGGKGSSPIIAESKTRGQILTAICPFLDQLATGKDLAGNAIPQSVTTKWLQRFNALQAGDAVINIDTPFQGMLQQLITDSLGTQTQINSVIQRYASRAENLFGAGTIIQPTDVFSACYNPDGSAK